MTFGAVDMVSEQRGIDANTFCARRIYLKRYLR